MSRPSLESPLEQWSARTLITAAVAPAVVCLVSAATIHIPEVASVLCAIGCIPPCLVAAALYRRLRVADQGHASAVDTMAARSSTVVRLLDLSQTIQAAGKPEQIFDALTLSLRNEFNLSGIAIVAHEPDALPPTTLKAIYPIEVAQGTPSVAEMDTGLCPCLRQNLPRAFKPQGSPVRCSIDQALRLPSEHPAYCIPFTVGRKTQCTVHMLLPPRSLKVTWDEDRKQLAQTYVNAASSSLITLHHLAEAEKQSLTDALTGLYNRRSLDQLMQREVALAERHGTSLSIVMIDLDKFKEINDAHGHAAGDYLLKSFADCVRITLRKTDLAFRYGGDEFLVALPQTQVSVERSPGRRAKTPPGVHRRRFLRRDRQPRTPAHAQHGRRRTNAQGQHADAARPARRVRRRAL